MKQSGILFFPYLCFCPGHLLVSNFVTRPINRNITKSGWAVVSTTVTFYKSENPTLWIYHLGKGNSTTGIVNHMVTYIYKRHDLLMHCKLLYKYIAPWIWLSPTTRSSTKRLTLFHLVVYSIKGQQLMYKVFVKLNRLHFCRH